MNALYLLLVIGWLATLVPIVTGSYCTQTYTCTKSQRYTTSCGFLGWKRCTRYRNVNSQCSRQVCCNGWTDPGCNQALCYGTKSCPNGGTCVSPNKCSCRPGYALPRCTDINECASSPCQNGARCVNEVNRYTCQCAAGYTGVNCQNDINECSSNNGGCAQQCVNLRGSFVCRCGSGYRLASNNRGCDDIDECAAGSSGCAHRCSNTVGGFQCSCNAGYTLDGNGKTCNGNCEKIVLFIFLKEHAVKAI
ncbi:fibulin-1-like [Lingula anatina]|uniref:Fibulin-1-like n=1 Tax=Lingula anatina TaxID=7574 RepID=A0A1S3JWA6_LINAN|nr:fibulin-1-like [Lingula anatina]|eukprot:XP_013414710.2 fibulin-1-like [Lingula anatina]